MIGFEMMLWFHFGQEIGRFVWCHLIYGADNRFHRQSGHLFGRFFIVQFFQNAGRIFGIELG
jgi:hypothetical protein